MNRPFRITFRARSDLDEIREHIAIDNPAAADRLLEKLRSRFVLLAQQPLIGEKRGDLRPHLRGSYVGNYAIYYRILEDDANIEIVRVVNAARDIREIF